MALKSTLFLLYCFSIAVDCTLYGFDVNAKTLNAIDPTSGATTSVCSFQESNLSNLVQVLYHPKVDTFFLMDEYAGNLYSFDLQSCSLTSISVPNGYQYLQSFTVDPSSTHAYLLARRVNTWDATLATLDCSTMKVLNFVNITSVGSNAVADAGLGYNNGLLYAAIHDQDTVSGLTTINPSNGNTGKVAPNYSSYNLTFTAYTPQAPDRLLTTDNIYIRIVNVNTFVLFNWYIITQGTSTSALDGVAVDFVDNMFYGKRTLHNEPSLVIMNMNSGIYTEVINADLNNIRSLVYV